MLPFAVIGAGPMGLCTARRLKQYQIPFIGFEINNDVGGLWDIESPTSTMYHSAHLISSKKMTEFKEFPMATGVADYPSHREMKKYFRDYASHFNLYDDFRFGSKVVKVTPEGDHWSIAVEDSKGTHTVQAAGILIANGTLHQPNRIKLPGEFSGERLHSADYKSAEIFENKRVLIIGCGNSGCDIAVDAVHRARSVDIVVRRGYYFVPKFIMGKPVDTVGGKIKLPNRLKQLVDGTIVRLVAGKPSDYGLPDPDYRIYESHPVINSLVLHHIGHGDIRPRAGIKSIKDKSIDFANGEKVEYDLLMEATGYHLHFPFIEEKRLNWQGFAPQLYLNVFHPQRDDIFLMGMVEAAGLGWQGRDDQAKLVALYLKKLIEGTSAAKQLQKVKEKELTRPLNGGLNYLKLERMAYYVHKGEYLKLVHRHIRDLEAG